MSRRFPIANRVRQRREASDGMTQSELGVKVGVTRQTIAAIEQRRYSPSLETAFKLALVFGCEINELFYWDDE